jgi:hypothetical protein
MNPKTRFEMLVAKVRRSNKIYIFDATLTSVLDYVEHAENPEVVMLYTGLLEQICKDKGIRVDRLIPDE